MSGIPVRQIGGPAPSSGVRLLTVEGGSHCWREDRLATEEPLEIRVTGTTPVITMRTPGHDLELAAGLLLSEGLVQRADDIVLLRAEPGETDAVRVSLRHFSASDAGLLRRSSLSNSACGVCGKDRLNLELLNARPPPGPGPAVDPQTLLSLPARLREAQGLFQETGGLHAAALFDAGGRLHLLREDVGRHNALDKLLGRLLLDRALPLDDHIVVLSGRASFELIQKCVMARAPVVCAVSAPSSYAVSLARRFGLTLVGFLRQERFNVYSAQERILGLPAAQL